MENLKLEQGKANIINTINNEIDNNKLPLPYIELILKDALYQVIEIKNNILSQELEKLKEETEKESDK